MADPALQKGYDEAAAVFSRSFSFVEWRFVIAVKEGTSTPFGDANESQRKATVKFDREKWVYVFANNGEHETWAEIKEEIRVSKDGEMAATPWEEIENERNKRGKRGNPVPIGKTMCLPRRIFGNPLVYRFFASRIRLPMAQIKELMGSVMRFAPPVIFDPGDNKSVIEQDDGTLLVPVVDPITIALHLHAAFSVAADDIINYSAAHKENKDRQAAERRSKKHLLAMILKSIIGEADKKEANNLVNELKDRQGPLEDFLTHHQREVQWRVDRRDRLGTFLARWMASDGMRIEADAYLSEKKKEFEKFLVPWSHAITRMGESPPGRKYLDSLLGDQKHFFNRYVWLANDPTDDAIQAIRKSGMTVFEAWKTIAERRITASPHLELADEVYAHFHRVRGQKMDTPFPKELTKGQRKQAKMKLADARREFKEQLKNLREYEKKLLKDLSSSAEPHTHFAMEPRKLGALVEGINFVISFSAMMDALKGEDPRAKQLAVVGFVGSTLDATSAVAAMSKRWDKVAPVLGFVSGIIDVYLADAAMDKAFKDGDQDAANGNFVVGVGSTMTATAGLMALASIPGGQIVAIIGVLVVAIGYIYKLLSGKEPIERYFAHCTWGKEYLQAGGGDWSPTRFEQWTEEGSGKEFDHQLEALLNIICKFEISAGKTNFREVKFKMGWLPPDSKLKVKYEEEWDSSADSRTLESEILLEEQGPRSTAANMAASADSKSGIKIAMVRGHLTSKETHQTEYESIDGQTFEVQKPVKALNKVVASGRLFVSFDGSPTMAIPHKDFEKKTIHS